MYVSLFTTVCLFFVPFSLHALHQARELGADVRGYIHWSLLDNYEWNRCTLLSEVVSSLVSFLCLPFVYFP